MASIAETVGQPLVAVKKGGQPSKFMGMVEAVAEVLSKSNGQQAVGGARKAVESYTN